LILSYEIFYHDKIRQNIGLMLMIADGAAAVIGSRMGKVKIYGSKTFEGLTAFIAVMFVSQSALSYLQNINNHQG
jgi:dolichol kinase